MKRPLTPMMKMLISVSIFFAIVFGVYGVKKALFFYYMARYQPPAVTVAACDAEQKLWASYLQTVGTIKAVNGIDLAPEVPGIIKEIHFTSGQTVNAGDVLIVLDNQVQTATLKDAQAKLQLAQLSYEREQTLVKRKASSKANLDARTAELAQAQASTDAALAQLNQRTIITPFTGHIGIRLVDLGQFVAAGTPLVTLQSINPLYVQFSLPEQNMANLYLDQPVEVKLNGQQTNVILGKITAINTKVDETTRNVLVQATIPNSAGNIYPGMFANVRVLLKGQQERIVIPQTAIAYSLSGDYVFVVTKDKNKQLQANRRYVKVGERRAGEAVVLQGLQPGEAIVTSGQVKLQNGAAIAIDNSKEVS